MITMIEIPELKPESTNEVVAQASRCALRTYAKNIERENPTRAREILNYVRDLDKREEQAFNSQRVENARKRNNQYCSVIMAILSQAKQLGMTEYSVEDLRSFLSKSRAYKPITPYLSHTVSLLVDAKKITIEEGFIQL